LENKTGEIWIIRLEHDEGRGVAFGFALQVVAQYAGFVGFYEDGKVAEELLDLFLG
jgi:hypothetical protein